MTSLAPHPHDIGPDPSAPLVELPDSSTRRYFPESRKTRISALRTMDPGRSVQRWYS